LKYRNWLFFARLLQSCKKDDRTADYIIVAFNGSLGCCLCAIKK
jgi:hypothetical protein